MTKRLKELKRALEAVEGVAERFEEAGLNGHAAELDKASELIEGVLLDLKSLN